MEEENIDEEKTLAITPSYSYSAVIVVMVPLGFFFQFCLNRCGKWLGETKKRKALLSALEKIKDELMLFGLLSLLMGHWVSVVAKICIKSSAVSSRFFPCAVHDVIKFEQTKLEKSSYVNTSAGERTFSLADSNDQCPKGHESFASKESLEQLHRLMFVLGTVHVLYSFVAIALAVVKLYSWKIWEKQAETMAIQSGESSVGPSQPAIDNRRMMQLTAFISHHTSHPWSQHKVLVWLLCFSRQFWSSINYDDYMVLRCGFINKHELPLAYDFHNYMMRSMEEEFRDIVGISFPLWIYAICCIFLDFHETKAYFWVSFLPAFLVLLIGTKLHRVVVDLAVEIMDTATGLGYRPLKLRDELFWFGKPKLLLWLIQLITFQNAFEMAAFLWSLWEIQDSSCFMSNEWFIVIRLSFGVITQFWCSFITFPLYVIVTQMDAKLKRTVVSEGVRQSIHGWKRRVKLKHVSSSTHRRGSPKFSSFSLSSKHKVNESASTSSEGSSRGVADKQKPRQEFSTSEADNGEKLPEKEIVGVPLFAYLGYGLSEEEEEEEEEEEGEEDQNTEVKR